MNFISSRWAKIFIYKTIETKNRLLTTGRNVQRIKNSQYNVWKNGNETNKTKGPKNHNAIGTFRSRNNYYLI